MDELAKPKETLPQTDFTKIQSPLLKEMIEAKLITEQGLRMQGMGILITQLDRVIELIDKANTRLYYIEKKLEKK